MCEADYCNIGQYYADKDYYDRERDSKAQSKKICEYCGRRFIPTSPRQKYCNRVHEAECIICGSRFVIGKPFTRSTCSSKCEAIRKINAELYEYLSKGTKGI